MPSINIPGVGPVGLDQVIGAVVGLISTIGLILGLTLGLGDSGSSSAVPSTTTSKPSVTTPATTKPSEPVTTEPSVDPGPTTKPDKTELPVPPTTEPKPEPGGPTAWTSEPLDGRKIIFAPHCRFGHSSLVVAGRDRKGVNSFFETGTVINTVHSSGNGDQQAPSADTYDVWGTFSFYNSSSGQNELVDFKVTGIKNACVFGEEVSEFVIQ